jgi:hypothetical protein
MTRHPHAVCGACLAVLAAALCAGAAWAGAPYRTDDPVPNDEGHVELDLLSQATHVQGNTMGFLPGFQANYGIAPNLEVHVILPLAFDRADGAGTRFGYGDTELGAKYRFIEQSEDGWRPQVGTAPLLELPTGDASRGLGGGHLRTLLPLLVRWDFDPWTTYGAAGYWINPGAGNKNYWAFGWVLQRKVTDALSLGGELFYRTADTSGGPASTGFDLGATYDFSAHFHLLFSAGSGLQNATTTNQFSYYFALQWTY